MKSLLKTALMTVLAMSLMSLSAQQTPDLEYKFGGKIQYTALTQAGVLLVAHGDGLAGIKPGSKELVFDFNDYGKVKQEEMTFTPNSPYVTIDQKGFSGISGKKSVLDYVTGKRLFETKGNGWKIAQTSDIFLPANKLVISGQRNSKEKFAMAVGIYDLATGKEDKLFYLQKPGKVSMGTVTVSGSPLMVENSIYVPTSKEILHFDTVSGEITWSAKIDDITWMTSDESGKEIYAFEQTNGGDTKIYKISSTGQVLWKDPQKVKGIVSRFQILPQGLAIVSDKDNSGKSVLAGASESKIAMLSASTGEDLWVKAPKTKGFVQHFYVMEDGILFGVQAGGINKISFEGATLFKKPLKTGANIHTMALTDQGMIYITDTDANIIDLNSGESIWGKPIKYKKATAVSSAYDKNNQRYLISTGNEIVAIDENSGKISSLASYKFEEKEAPSSLMVRDGGLLLTSDQNVMLLNFEGKEQFHEYYKSPGKSTFGKILAGVTAVAATTMASAAAYRAGMNKNSIGNYNSYGSEMKRTQDMFASIGGTAFNEMNKRFKATAATENAQFILTKLNDGVGLVKVNKNTGAKEKEIILKDKKPEYTVDDFGGMLYYQLNANTIYAYDLK